MSANEINAMIEAIAGHTLSQMPKGDGMTFGTIKSLNPLSIRVDNQNFDLPEEFFYLGQWCRPFRVTMPHKHEFNAFMGNGGQTEYGHDDERKTIFPHKHDIIEQITEDTHQKFNPASITGYYQDYVEVEIMPKLKIGDRVLLLAFNGGQKYYVAERIERDDMWDDKIGIHPSTPKP